MALAVATWSPVTMITRMPAAWRLGDRVAHAFANGILERQKPGEAVASLGLAARPVGEVPAGPGDHLVAGGGELVGLPEPGGAFVRG